MDLLDFEPGSMYFDEPLDPRAQTLLAEAALAYGDPEAEAKLLEAEAIVPEHLSVLVALYRYYFYRHHHSAAISVAGRAMDVVARRLNFSNTWAEVEPDDIARASTGDRKSTRLNSSHRCISYAVFCLKKKKTQQKQKKKKEKKEKSNNCVKK